MFGRSNSDIRELIATPFGAPPPGYGIPYTEPGFSVSEAPRWDTRPGSLLGPAAPKYAAGATDDSPVDEYQRECNCRAGPNPRSGSGSPSRPRHKPRSPVTRAPAA